jgi:5-methylcytosine-specific restriction enzyme subunit McrC
MTSDLRIVQLTEWETGRQAPVAELTESDRQLATTLRQADGGRLLIDERRDGVWLSATSWVGVVRFAAFEIRVIPKLAGGNVGVVRMLDYALGVGALRRYESARELETLGDSLLELIAWLLGRACDGLVRDGLLSDYVAREETLHVLRGRLRLKDQVGRRFLQVDPLEVAFDEFETDIGENQILAAALEATRGLVRNETVQRLVRRQHAIFLEACDPSKTDGLTLLDEMTYSRRNEHYRYPHLLARLLLRRLAVRDLFTPGGTTSFAFLIDMNELFEAFVTKLADEALGRLGMRVHAQRRDPSIILDDATGKRYGTIIPDLLIEARRGDDLVRLPVDAKYKLYDQRRIDEGDIYQTFFYAFAYAAKSGPGTLARALILYPRAGAGTDSSLRVETYLGQPTARIQAFGVDIDAALNAISAGSVSIASIPSFARVHRVVTQLLANSAQDESWRALPA